MRIAIIDTGISEEYSSTNNYIHMINPQAGYDAVGHGTEVLNLLDDRVHHQDIYIYKIMSKRGRIRLEDLALALGYMIHLKPDVINLSMGTRNDINGVLKGVVEELEEKGILIVSSAENLGAISYPAYYSSTLSVIWDRRITRVMDFRSGKDNSVDIHGYGGELQAVGSMRLERVGGSSFLAPLLVSEIINKNLFKSTPVGTIKNVKKYFEYKPNRFFQPYLLPVNGNYKNIKKAITFPYNKEIETLVNNADRLDFSIVGFIDCPFSKFVGHPIDDVLYRRQKLEGTIQSINTFDWECAEFDTIIVGHLERVSELYKTNFMKRIIRLAKKYNKQTFFFDSVHNVDFNFDLSNDISSGAMFTFHSPVVAVVGADSKVGKADLEMRLQAAIESCGYDASLFMTEPYYQLLGNKRGWVNGFSTHISNWETEVLSVNRLMKQLDLENHDIIIVGTQSQVIPTAFSNTFFFPQGTQDVLVATHPDAIILAISATTTDNQVVRMMDYLNGYFSIPVIAIYSLSNKPVYEAKEVLHSSQVPHIAKKVVEFFTK